MQNLKLTSDQRYWWRTCEPAVSGLMKHTGSYTPEEQKEHLQWFARYITPWFGLPHSPSCGISLTLDKSPVELSLNLQSNGPSMVRFGIQLVPNGVDAFDFTAKLDMLRPLFDQVSGTNLQWFHTLSNSLILHDHDEIEKARALTPLEMKGQPPTMALGINLDGHQRRLKAYVFPIVKSWATGKEPNDIVISAIRSFNPRDGNFKSALDLLEWYVSEGCIQPVILTMIGMDCVDPSYGARIKIYGNLYTSNAWDVVSHVYTLGGRVNDDERVKGLRILHSIWDLLRGEKESVADSYSKPLRVPGSVHGDFTASFEMSPGCAVPQVKIYTSVWQYGATDREIAQNIVLVMRRLGWDEEANKYMKLLEECFPYADLDGPPFLHTYVSYAYTEKTGVYLSVYFSSSGQSVSLNASIREC